MSLGRQNISHETPLHLLFISKLVDFAHCKSRLTDETITSKSHHGQRQNSKTIERSYRPESPYSSRAISTEMDGSHSWLRRSHPATLLVSPKVFIKNYAIALTCPCFGIRQISPDWLTICSESPHRLRRIAALAVFQESALQEVGFCETTLISLIRLILPSDAP